MGFAAVARVTEDRWIACSVRDEISFGLQPGGELKVETTICHEIRQSREPVIINLVTRLASTSASPSNCQGAHNIRGLANHAGFGKLPAIVVSSISYLLSSTHVIGGLR